MSVLSSWLSRRFMSGVCVLGFTTTLSTHTHIILLRAILFPVVVTVYITWWFLTFFDNFFSVRPPQSSVLIAHNIILPHHSRCINICWVVRYLD